MEQRKLLMSARQWLVWFLPSWSSEAPMVPRTSVEDWLLGKHTVRIPTLPTPKAALHIKVDSGYVSQLPV